MQYIAMFLLLALMSAQCTPDRETREGGLSLFGAEPFVQLALITDEDERIFLDADKELLDSLWIENQGRIQIQGKIYEGEWNGRPHDFMRIEEWEWVVD